MPNEKSKFDHSCQQTNESQKHPPILIIIKTWVLNTINYVFAAHLKFRYVLKNVTKSAATTLRNSRNILKYKSCFEFINMAKFWLLIFSRMNSARCSYLYCNVCTTTLRRNTHYLIRHKSRDVSSPKYLALLDFVFN